MKEIWKDIENYEGYYQVSNLGRIRSVTREVIHKNGNKHTYYGSIKSQSFDKDGYKIVTFSKDSIKKSYKVHRLVAAAFLDNPNNYSAVNHKNEDKTDNCVDNLEWCDNAYNNQYGTRLERISVTQGTPIVQLTIEGEYVARYNSMSRAGAAVNGYAAPIKCALIGKSYISYDYCWCYEWEYDKYFRTE